MENPQALEGRQGSQNSRLLKNRILGCSQPFDRPLPPCHSHPRSSACSSKAGAQRRGLQELHAGEGYVPDLLPPHCPAALRLPMCSPRGKSTTGMVLGTRALTGHCWGSCSSSRIKPPVPGTSRPRMRSWTQTPTTRRGFGDGTGEPLDAGGQQTCSQLRPWEWLCETHRPEPGS